MAKRTHEKTEDIRDYIKIFSARLNEVVTNQLRWSQGEFGRKLGITQASAGRYLNGSVSPGWKLFGKIEQVTRVPLWEFFKADGSLPKPQGLRDDLRDAVTEGSAENLALLKTIAGHLDPALKTMDDSGQLAAKVTVASRGKLRDFVDRFTDESMTGYIYELMSENASEETKRIELVRELTVNLLAEGGKTAKETRKMLTELLEKEKSIKK